MRRKDADVNARPTIAALVPALFIIAVAAPVGCAVKTPVPPDDQGRIAALLGPDVLGSPVDWPTIGTPARFVAPAPATWSFVVAAGPEAGERRERCEGDGETGLARCDGAECVAEIIAQAEQRVEDDEGRQAQDVGQSHSARHHARLRGEPDAAGCRW